jgi:hypothetical protein
MDAEGDEEMGPIDHLLVEWPGRLPVGDVAPSLSDLVEGTGSRLPAEEDRVEFGAVLEPGNQAPPAANPPAAGGVYTKANLPAS